MADDQRSQARKGRQSATESAQLVAKPTVGVVVPVYRHSMLVAEAVLSAVEQSLQPSPHIVIVDDGCEFPETSQICRSLAAAHPDKVSYVRRSNGGLSAARNTGIDFLLARFPYLRAIYFLDADNRLRRDALEGALRRLDQSETVGWVYPNLSMFGVAAEFDYGGPYSHLIQRSMNQSEAGSLVRAQVFRQGVRFDETMRRGYEDWSFFLSLSELGWRGEHLDDFGLQYRKRGESMLSDSTRVHSELESFIRRKHRNAYSLRTLLNLEQVEAPRYMIFLADRGEFVLTTDPRKSVERIDIVEFCRRYWHAELEPNRQFFPPFLVVTTQSAIDELTESGLLPFAFWRLEAALGSCSFGFLQMDAKAAQSITLAGPLTAEEGDRARLRAQIGMTRLPVLREVLSDQDTNWIDTLITPSPLPRCQSFVLSTTAARTNRTLGTAPIVHTIGHVLSLLRQSAWREGSRIRLTSRRPGILPRVLCFETVRRSTGSPEAPVFPAAAPPSERHVGFLLPLFAFGGVEKAATEAARVFRSRGWRPHLFVGPDQPVRLPDSVAGVFETTTLVDADTIGSWGADSSYLGTPMPSLASSPYQQPRAIGLLGWLDAVVNCHSAGGHAIMSLLRGSGVVTLCHQHVADQTPAGRPNGQPMLGLAFEHAYDRILCCSNTLAQWYLAMGAPPSKIMVAPNAPGYPLDNEKVAKIIADRGRRSPTNALRVLFSGRLDRQKGLAHLVRTIDLARQKGLPIEWRIVGDAVLDPQAVGASLARLGVDRRGAEYTSAAMTAHYGWADVVFMPSRWEGLPLTLLEAMRVGVVPVATDVGAVCEICVEEETGRLIDPTSDVPGAAVEILAALANDRQHLARLAGNAHALAAGRSWNAAFAPIVDAVEAQLQRRSR